MIGVEITESDASARRWAVHVHQHVVPVGDLIEHELCEACPCRPRQEDGKGGGIIFVHHAVDQRENDERNAA